MDILSEPEKLALWRKRNRVSLKVVAEYIGCSQSLISRYENEITNMESEKIRLYRKFVSEYK